MRTLDETAVFVVNTFGDHDHPPATPDNLHTFSRPYIFKCARRAIRLKALTAEARRLALEGEGEI